MRVAGTATTIAALFLSSSLHAADGVLDTTFGSSGVFTYSWNLGGGDDDEITDLVGVPGALFVVGFGDSITSDTDWFLMGLDEAGNVTALRSQYFDIGGTRNDLAQAAFDDGNGGLIVAGVAAESTHDDIVICRFLESSSTFDRDNSWGGSGNGCREFDLGAGTSFNVTAIAPMPNGTGSVVGGTISSSGSSGFFTLRVFENGNVDPFYGSSGLATVTFSEGNAYLTGLAVDSGLGVLLVGYVDASFTDHLAFAKLTGDGTLDTAFNGSGKDVFTSPAPAISTCAAYDGTFFGVGLEEFSSQTSTGRVHKMDLLGDLYYASSSDVTWDTDGTNHPLRILDHGDGSLQVASYYQDQGLVGAVFAGTRFPCLGCSADTSFGVSGLAKFQPAAAGLGEGYLRSATDWTGRLAEGGVANGAGDNDWVIVRFTSAKLFADGWENPGHHWSARQP